MSNERPADAGNGDDWNHADEHRVTGPRDHLSRQPGAIVPGRQRDQLGTHGDDEGLDEWAEEAPPARPDVVGGDVRYPELRHAADHQSVGVIKEKESQVADREEEYKRDRSPDLPAI